MSLKKIFMIVLGVTIIALLYVYQQSKIIQLAYQEQEQLALHDNLVNKNNNLRYNLDRQMSLVSIANLWQEEDFEWPHGKQLLSLSTMQQESEDSKQINPVRNTSLLKSRTKISNGVKETESIFTRIFGLKSQAEATPVKPR